jgi:hypothetical protein
MFNPGDRVTISLFGNRTLAKVVGRSKIIPNGWVLDFYDRGLPSCDSFPERAITSVGDRVSQLHLVSKQDGLGTFNTILGGK